MKAVLTLMSLMLILNSVQIFAQNQSDFEDIRKRIEAHEELHRRMREKILFGRGDDDIFKDLDSMFNDMMNDSSKFEPRNEFALSAAFKNEWTSSNKGRTLILTPKDPSIQLDISVKDQFITIGAKEESKTQNSQMESSTSSVFPVPSECDGNKVEMKSVGKSIHLFFPFKSGVTPQKSITLPQKKNGDQNDRRPIKPSQGDVEI